MEQLLERNVENPVETDTLGNEDDDSNDERDEETGDEGEMDLDEDEDPEENYTSEWDE